MTSEVEKEEKKEMNKQCGPCFNYLCSLYGCQKSKEPRMRFDQIVLNTEIFFDYERLAKLIAENLRTLSVVKKRKRKRP